jgi:hypothetical protein
MLVGDASRSVTGYHRFYSQLTTTTTPMHSSSYRPSLLKRAASLPLLLAACACVSAGELIVGSPKGNDNGSGSAGPPCDSIDYALGRAKPGYTVMLRDGVFAVTSSIRVTLTGTAQAAWHGPVASQRQKTNH